MKDELLPIPFVYVQKVTTKRKGNKLTKKIGSYGLHTKGLLEREVLESRAIH